VSPAPSNDTIQLYGTFIPPTPANPASSSSSSAPRLLNKGELYSTIESYLLSGRREEAVATAVLHKEWTLALLISSNCGEEEYREVSKAFAVATFPSASPLHLAALLFSNQV
jgi:Sec23-binding domain of Sec16